MPHAPGHGRYGFGTGMPEDIYGAFSNVAPFVPPEYTEERMRTAMGFVPVAGTAYNWNEMGPWERALSVGLDVADVATLGSGKAVTFPIKTVSKAIQKFMMRNDPKLAYVRGGFLPTIPHVRAPKGVQGRTADWQPDPYMELMFAAGQGDKYKVYPSFNYAAGAFEPGISTYQALKYSKGMDDPQWVMRNMPDELVTREYPNRFNPVTGKPMTYDINPRVTQRHIMQDVMAGDVPMFENRGMRILASEGTDTEALIDAAARVKTSTRLDPADIWHGQIGDEGFAQKQFAKYDELGNLIPYDIEKWADQAWLASTLPYTTAGRSGLDFTWDTPGLFGDAEIEPPIQRAEGEGKILSLGALP
jgi:hypothetical protein